MCVFANDRERELGLCKTEYHIHVCLCVLGRHSGSSGGKGMNKDLREATERFLGQ